MVMSDNEYKTKENKNWTKDKTEPQHVHVSDVIVSLMDDNIYLAFVFFVFFFQGKCMKNSEL